MTSVKVYTKHEGFHRIEASDLADVLLLTETEVAAASFFVENLGREVASVRDGGDIIFYAHEYKGPHTDINVFWVKPGDPSVLPLMSVGPGSSPYAASFPVTRTFEEHNAVRTEFVDSIDEDPIYWRLISSGFFTKSYTTTVHVHAVDTASPASLRVRLKGATDMPGRSNHRARIDLNGVTLGVIDFVGLESKEKAFPLSPGQLLSGANVVHLESTPPPGTFFDSFYLDNYHVDFHRLFTAADGWLSMGVDSQSIEITDFPNNSLRVWDVTDQWAIREVAGHQVYSAGTGWRLTFDTTEDVRLAAVASGHERQPEELFPYYDMGLKENFWELDHLVISCPDLFSSALDLTLYRESQGLDADIIWVDDIYDAFNYGIRDARAIERFLLYAYRNWSKHPRYVALVGDGSVDFYDLMGHHDSRIPSTRLMGQNGLYLSDYLLGNIGGTGQLEMAVGRIPVNDLATLDDYIAKLIAYENGGAWRENQLVTTDQNDYGGDFLGMGNSLSSYMQGHVYRGDLTTQNIVDVRTEVINGINGGREITTYIGHGTPVQLSSQAILGMNDITLLTNDASPTAFMAIGCLIGAFHYPGKVNMGEGLVNARGGAASLIAASTFITAADGFVLTEAVLKEIYSNGVARIGDAWISGKNTLTANFRLPSFVAFQLLGDPAMAVGSPYSARTGTGAPSMPGYGEWTKSITPPVLEDEGFSLQPNEDQDGDLLTNHDEYRAGTDPFDSASNLQIVEINHPFPGYIELVWPSEAGRSYTVEAALNPHDAYEPLMTGIPATAPINVEWFAENLSVPKCYRLVVE